MVSRVQDDLHKENDGTHFKENKGNYKGSET